VQKPHSQDPDAGANGKSYCECSSSALTTMLPMMTSTNNPCGYTSLPTPKFTTALPPPQTSGPSNPFPYTFTYPLGGILGCNTVSYHLVGGTSIGYCAGACTTIIAAPTPSPAPTNSPITCSFCDAGFGWTFTISGSGRGNGLPDLQHQLDGCGALTGWTIQGVNVQFNLDFFIKSGCVERAI
jgi:hypothetical protein